MKYNFTKEPIRFYCISALITGMVLLFIAAEGCSSDYDSANPVEDLDIPEEYIEVGVLHNQKAASTLSETDAAVIYCATSTGYHSYQYWIENHTKMSTPKY